MKRGCSPSLALPNVASPALLLPVSAVCDPRPSSDSTGSEKLLKKSLHHDKVHRVMQDKKAKMAVGSFEMWIVSSSRIQKEKPLL